LCLECLEKIDADVVAKKVSLGPTDLGWTTGLALSPAEIDLGLRISVDFLEDKGEPWRLLMTRYHTRRPVGQRPLTGSAARVARPVAGRPSDPTPPESRCLRFLRNPASTGPRGRLE
jgi:hypothetical protein